jgi:hypothetical protein
MKRSLARAAPCQRFKPRVPPHLLMPAECRKSSSIVRRQRSYWKDWPGRLQRTFRGCRRPSLQPPLVAAAEDRWNATLGCKTSEAALMLLSQIVALEGLNGESSQEVID